MIKTLWLKIFSVILADNLAISRKNGLCELVSCSAAPLSALNNVAGETALSVWIPVWQKELSSLCWHFLGYIVMSLSLYCICARQERWSVYPHCRASCFIDTIGSLLHWTVFKLPLSTRICFSQSPGTSCSQWQLPVKSWLNSPCCALRTQTKHVLFHRWAQVWTSWTSLSLRMDLGL